MDIRFLGHACFELEHGGTTVLIDPFLTGNPKAAVQAADLAPDAILVTHGHGDHLGDTVDIARRTGAPVVAIVELAREIADALGGDHPVFDPNVGGTVTFDWGTVQLQPAWHTGVSPSGTPHTPAGLLIEMGDSRIYHLGDTALFSDLALPRRRGRLNVALVPIGGHYTMDRFDAVVAAEFVGADQIIPCHYDTFPLIETDAHEFKNDVQEAGFGEVVVLEPGQAHRLRP
jgi:L-ascorbate metabolism protein UlaG (beta-lactamase superfamily)